jgi:hypothetical protein
MKTCWNAAGLAVAWLLTVVVAGAEESNDVRSVFFVAKSENKNQVHYGVHMGADCAPSGPAPVFAYWQMLEKGPGATEPLLGMEAPAYGFASQRVTAIGPSGGTVLVTLRAMPERPIVVTTRRQGGSCVAVAETQIDGASALLTRVFVQLRWPFGVESLTLDGYAGGHAVRERMKK